MMTNRQRLLNANLYDFLSTINRRILDGEEGQLCLMMYIDSSCLKGCVMKSCGECIQTWLNKEEDHGQNRDQSAQP